MPAFCPCAADEARDGLQLDRGEPRELAHRGERGVAVARGRGGVELRGRVGVDERPHRRRVGVPAARTHAV